MLPPLQASWAKVAVTYNPFVIDIVGTLLVQIIFWWIPSTLFVSLDYIAPAFSQRHKIQPAPKQPTFTDIRQAALVSLRNQALVIALHLLLTLGAIHAGETQPSLRVEPRLPSAAELARDFAISALAREALFYYSHRLFHCRALYARVHKFHHRFTAPVAFASQYAHPVEHLLANALPIALPPMILGAHVVTMWVFLAFQLVETATVHSGYDFFSGAARKHDRHHERFDVYFGGIGLLDWVHGTDEKVGRKKAE